MADNRGPMIELIDSPRSKVTRAHGTGYGAIVKAERSEDGEYSDITGAPNPSVDTTQETGIRASIKKALLDYWIGAFVTGTGLLAGAIWTFFGGMIRGAIGW